jgi:hypothetical protein
MHEEPSQICCAYHAPKDYSSFKIIHVAEQGLSCPAFKVTCMLHSMHHMGFVQCRSSFEHLGGIFVSLLVINADCNKDHLPSK